MRLSIKARRGSAARQLDGQTRLAKPLGHALPMISLDLDDPVPHRASGATEPSELTGARLDGGAPVGKAADHGDGLAAAPPALGG